MSDNESVHALEELLASLSPPPHAVIDSAAAQAANGAENDNVLAFMGDHTVVDYIPVVNECPICLESYAVEPCVRITGIDGCNHQLGQNCLERMLRSRPNEEKRCPLCRAVWIPGQGGNSPQLIVPPHAPSSVDNDSDFEEIESSQAIEDIRAGRLNRLNRLNTSAAGLSNNADRSAITDNRSQPSSNTLETAIVLDSGSDDDDYETQRRNYESFARDIQDVRSRARQTQLSRSERRQEERSQRRREEQQRSQTRREQNEYGYERRTQGHEAARGRSRSLSGNRRHTNDSGSSSASRRSDPSGATASSGFFTSFNPFRPTATGLVDGDRSRVSRRGSRARRPGTGSTRGRIASPPRRGTVQRARDTSPPQVAFSPPPRQSSLQLPPGFAAPGSIATAPAHVMISAYNERARNAQPSEGLVPGYGQAELAEITNQRLQNDFREAEIDRRETRSDERAADLDRREFEVHDAEQRMAEMRDMMARHQQELRELLERHQQEIERVAL